MAQEKENKKRPAEPFTQEDAQYIDKVAKYFRAEKENAKRGIYPNFNQVNQRTADATGFQLRTIERHVHDVETGEVNNLRRHGEPQTRDRPMEIEQDPEVAYYWLRIIRDLTRELYALNTRWPTIHQILEKIKSKPNHTRRRDFHWSEDTMTRFMKKHGFVVKPRMGYYDHVRSKQSMIEQRDQYVIKVDEYRKAGLDIFYGDETWGSQNMDKDEGWCWEGDYDEEGEWINEPVISPPPMTSTNTGTLHHIIKMWIF